MNDDEHSSCEFIVNPCDNAPSAMKGLKVEPGASCAWVGRDSSGSPDFLS